MAVDASSHHNTVVSGGAGEVAKRSVSAGKGCAPLIAAGPFAKNCSRGTRGRTFGTAAVGVYFKS